MPSSNEYHPIPYAAYMQYINQMVIYASMGDTVFLRFTDPCLHVYYYYN